MQNKIEIDFKTMDLTMTQLLFRIYCLTTLLHVGYATSSRPKLEIVKAKIMEKEYIEHTPKKSLMFFVHDLPSEIPEESSQEVSLTNQNLSGEILEVVQNMLRMGSHRRPRKVVQRHTSEERLQIRKKKEDQEEHERKVKEVIKHVSEHYQSNIYIYYEAERIQRTGMIKDELRQLLEDILNPKHRGRFKAKAVECGKPIFVPPSLVWPKPNTVVNVVKDTLNDGVFNK